MHLFVEEWRWRMDFYVIIVVTPVQYVISEDIRKEGCNVPRVWTR